MCLMSQGKPKNVSAAGIWSEEGSVIEGVQSRFLSLECESKRHHPPRKKSV